MSSMTGKLLIAAPDLHDPNFVQSVILMIHHDPDEGATGVILNHPSGATVGEVWQQINQVALDNDEPVFVGGPVEGPLLAIHCDSEVSGRQLMNDVFLSMDRDELNQIATQPPGSFRIFSGYSGWGPGQLEHELEQGGWLVYDAQPHHIFDDEDRLWRDVCERVGRDVLVNQVGRMSFADPGLN